MASLSRLSSLLLLGSLALAACSDDGASASAGPLSDDEQAFLQYTREEEKLARDAYQGLGAAHVVFSNIAASEQTHMDAVATLLTTYGLADPALGRATGEFVDPTLQQLYADLMNAGSASTLAALAVGVEIEELDLVDIERGALLSTHADIDTTIDNLSRGSRNHLRSFYANLVALGGSYTPKHLDQASFDAIVTSDPERGPGRAR